MLLNAEPVIAVGIVSSSRLRFELKGTFQLLDQVLEPGHYEVFVGDGLVVTSFTKAECIDLIPLNEDSTFILKQVKIGINFHWEQDENQEFEGILRLQTEGDQVRAVNRIRLEKYLMSVISSEMSAMNDLNLLKAHAIVSRSWLMAQLEKSIPAKKAQHSLVTQNKVIRWYDRDDHDGFDVCADDHCQRYQGLGKIISPKAEEAVQATRGQFLLYNHRICDARFSKCCGGITEAFENTWQAVKVPYLTPVIDAPIENKNTTLIASEAFYYSSPKAFCNTTDPEVLQQVLIDFDRSTTNFFRWEVKLTGDELWKLLLRKSGIDFGEIIDLVPVERGTSGRISRLKIIGTKQSIVVGKELEIRKWLSESHLYSSAFAVEKIPGKPSGFRLIGAGWGHGVGMCQIGAAVMSRQGYHYLEILKHYFTGAQIKKLYNES